MQGKDEKKMARNTDLVRLIFNLYLICNVRAVAFCRVYRFDAASNNANVNNVPTRSIHSSWTDLTD